MGSARAEDPLGKVFFFTKLAEAVPTESAVFCRSGLSAFPRKNGREHILTHVTAQFMYFVLSFHTKSIHSLVSFVMETGCILLWALCTSTYPVTRAVQVLSFLIFRIASLGG